MSDWLSGLLKWLFGDSGSSSPSGPVVGHEKPPPPSSAGKSTPKTYRPSYSVAERPAILFRPVGNTTDIQIDQDIVDLVDALTGVPLQPSLGLYQCQKCKVFYQTQSYEVIRSENGGRCVSCLESDIQSVIAQKSNRGRNADVQVITLENYQQHFGRVITFESPVRKVLTSRRGTDYAVMFENKTWARGFKMVVFRGDVNRVGGARYLLALSGRRVRVRGLVIRHPIFGDEIIVSDPSMILSIT